MEILAAILVIVLLLITPLGRGVFYLIGWMVGMLAWLAVLGTVALLVVGLTQ